MGYADLSGDFGRPVGHDAEAGLPPHVELRRRAFGITVLGIILVVGFLAPVMNVVLTPGACTPCGGCGVRTEFAFVSFSQSFGANVHWLARVVAMSPLLAGIGAILLARFLVDRRRGWALVGLWLVPVLAVLAFMMHLLSTDATARRVAQPAAAELAKSAVGYTLFALSAGILGIFIAARTRWYRPRSAAAFWIGRIGGVLFVVGLLVPVLDSANGVIPLMLPFKMVSMGGVFAWLGFWLLVSMGMTVAAAVTCFGTGPDIEDHNARRLSSRAFRLQVGAMALFGVAVALATLWTVKCSISMLPVVFFAGIKIGGCGVAWWFLLPFGVTELLLGEPTVDPSLVDATGDETATACAPPVDDGPPAADPFYHEGIGHTAIPAGASFHRRDTERTATEGEEEADDTVTAPAPVAAPVTSATMAPTAAPPEIAAKLAKLRQFRDADMLTQDEYDARVDKLMTSVDA